MIRITHEEAQLVCLTKGAIGAMNALVVFLHQHQDLLPKAVFEQIVEADYLLNSAEDCYINDDPERVTTGATA